MSTRLRSLTLTALMFMAMTLLAIGRLQRAQRCSQ